MSVLNEMGPVIALIDFNPVYFCALGAGDVDKVFETIQRLIGLRLIAGTNLRASFISDEVRADPRWQELEEYMNFPGI